MRLESCRRARRTCVISLSAALGYVLTRSIAVPGDLGDRDNWLEPLGLAALIIEWIVVILAGLALIRA